MKREQYYTLEVYGHLWSGPKAVYSCRVDTDKVSDENVGSFCGDFESVTDWRLVRCSHDYESQPGGLFRRIDEYKTLRGFRKGMTPRRFYRLANR